MLGGKRPQRRGDTGEAQRKIKIEFLFSKNISMSETHVYDNGEIKVLWQPTVCKHTGICFRGLPQVFDPRKRPWVNMKGATTEEILAQVRRCPSGALSIVENL